MTSKKENVKELLSQLDYLIECEIKLTRRDLSAKYKVYADGRLSGLVSARSLVYGIFGGKK